MTVRAIASNAYPRFLDQSRRDAWRAARSSGRYGFVARRAVPVNTIEDVKTVLGRALQLGDKAKKFDAATALFGNIPEFDSMAVVTVVTALEERFGIVVEDDEITADIFETVGSLSRFVEGKLGA
jgi:acyl carrier protein